MKISVLTVCPEMFGSFLCSPVPKRAVSQGKAEIGITDMRKFAGGSFRHMDDSPYGGGSGMILRCEPVLKAIESVRTPGSRVVLLSPKGVVFNQTKAKEYASVDHLILVCGHYEGVDARVEKHCDELLSVGNYILTGGEIPAMAVSDAVIRLLPGVLKDGVTGNESFENGLYEYPQYTRPADYNGDRVPEVLLNGNQKEIDKWRLEHSVPVEIKKEDY